MLEDGSIIANERSASAKAVSVEPQMEPARTLSSHEKEQPKALDGVDALTAHKPPTEPLDPPASPDGALPQNLYRRVVGEVDHGAETVASPPSANAPWLHQQSESGASPIEQEEWEVKRIVDRRRMGKGFQYRVRWKDTWMAGNELVNAKRLLQEYEARRRAQ